MYYVDFMEYLINIFMIVSDEVNLMFIIFIYDVGIIVISLIVDLMMMIVICLGFLLRGEDLVLKMIVDF
jgi:hypothetical protein